MHKKNDHRSRKNKMTIRSLILNEYMYEIHLNKSGKRRKQLHKFFYLCTIHLKLQCSFFVKLDILIIAFSLSKCILSKESILHFCFFDL